jgi:tetratricopeptide (TPR) repeat protein
MELKRREHAAAERSFSAAIAADPSLANAWANRATLRFRQGEWSAALTDIDRALALRDDSDIRFNRGRIFEAEARWAEASADYCRALALATGATDHIRRHLDACNQGLAANDATAVPAHEDVRKLDRSP